MTDPYALDPVALVGGEADQRWWVGLRLPWFRSLPVSCIESIVVTIGTRRFEYRELAFTLGVLTLDQHALAMMSDRYWAVTETLWLTATDRAFQPDVGNVADVEVTLRMPDGRGPDGAWPERTVRASFTFGGPRIDRLGVCTFSFAGEFRRGRSLEACLDRVAALGYTGVEILGAQVVDGYPSPSTQSLDRLSRAVRSASLTPVCYDAFSDPGRDRSFTDDDGRILGWAISELDDAVRLDCRFIRINLPFRTGLFERIAAEAQQREVTVLTELHAQTAHDPAVQTLLGILRALESQHLGLVLDLSCVMRSLPQGYVDRILRQALPESASRLIEDGWMAGETTSQIDDQLRGLDPETYRTAAALWGRTGRLFRKSGIDWLDEVVPLTRIVHGKFFGMDDGDEAAVPYRNILEKLKNANFDGHIMSEYEGHLWTEEPDTFEQLRAHRNLITATIHD